MPTTAVDEDDPDELWRTALILMDSVKEEEMLAPTICPRRNSCAALFATQELTLAQPAPVRARCRCSAGRVETTLKSFPRAEVEEMKGDDGTIAVTCEFCKTAYVYTDTDLDRLYGKG